MMAPQEHSSEGPARPAKPNAPPETIAASQRDIERHRRPEEMIHAQLDLHAAVSAAKSLADGLRLCLQTAINISGMDSGGVYLVDEHSGALDLAFHLGLTKSFIEAASHYDADTPSARLVMAGAPVYTNWKRLISQLGIPPKPENLLALAVVPIRHEGRSIACLNVASHTLDEVPTASRDALELVAANIGSAIARLGAAEEVRRERDYARSILNTAPVIITVLDSQGFIQQINPRGLEFTGYAKPAELKIRSFMDFVDEPHRQTAREALSEALTSDDVKEFEVRMKRADGEEARFQWRCSRLRGSHGAGDSILAIGTDDTERYRLLEQAQRDAGIKENLLSELNHRVKNNLATISSFLYLARGDTRQSKEDFINSSLHRVASLSELHSLLSENLAGGMEVARLLRRVVGATMSASTPPHPKLDFEFESNAEKIMMDADRSGGLAMAVSELVSNAIEHGLPDAAQPRLVIRFLCEQSGGRIEIIDNGPGLPEGFDILQGVGTGLMLTRQIAQTQLHGGLTLARREDQTVATLRFTV